MLDTNTYDIRMNQPVSNILDQIRNLLSEELMSMNDYIRSHLHSDVELVNQLSEHIIKSGGKRIRPILVLLVANALGHCERDHMVLATIIEFIHTATLLHDDIVDAADLRRGNETANFIWGNGAAVLVGDFLYSRAFQMMVEIGEMAVMDDLSETTNKLAEGEVLQLINCGDIELTQQKYFDVIERKTAKLFASATRLSAALAKQDLDTIAAMQQFGMSFGRAYQFIDDALDYQGTSNKTGKKIGKDLEEGKMTLPLIYALEKTAHPKELTKAIKKKKIKRILEAIEETKASAYTLACARSEIQVCREVIEQLNDSKYKTALLDLIEFVVSRSY